MVGVDKVCVFYYLFLLFFNYRVIQWKYIGVFMCFSTGKYCEKFMKINKNFEDCCIPSTELRERGRSDGVF